MSDPVLTRESTVRRLRELAPQLRERGVASVALFGSVARDEAQAGSDVDVLIELSKPMGFEFFALEDYLTDMLGAPVELSTRAGMRPRVLAAAEADLVRIF
jgi:predicted nucleotidyltransferase